MVESCSILDFSVGHHSTSDDSFAYRARAEVEDRKRIDNPITRFQLFMKSKGWWNAEDEAELKARLKADVMKAFKRTDSLKRCELGELFTDIYGGLEPWNIVSHIVLCEFLSLALLMANRGNNEMNSRDS